MDPLAERRIGWSPYTYVLNNPLLRIDPNGLTDYTFNKNTGEVNEVVYDDKDQQDANESAEKDRIVKIRKHGKRKGQVKSVTMKGVAKGILEDGQNWKKDDQIIDVNGIDQPSLAEFEDFITNLSNDVIQVEIAGVYLSTKDSKNAEISKVYVDEYDGNGARTGNYNLKRMAEPALNKLHTITDFHTHRTNIHGLSRNDIEKPSGIADNGRSGDISHRDKTKGQFHNYIILTRTASSPSKVMKIPYTDW